MLLGSNEKSQDSEGWHVVQKPDKIHCSHCKKIYKHEKSYLQHHEKEHKMKAYNCYICDVQIRGKKKFLDHRQKNQCRLFACNACDFKTNKMLIILNHVSRTIHLVQNQDINAHVSPISNVSQEKNTPIESYNSNDIEKELHEGVASPKNAIETSDNNQGSVEKEDPKNTDKSSNDDTGNPLHTSSPKECDNCPSPNQESIEAEINICTKNVKKSSNRGLNNPQSENTKELKEKECGKDRSVVNDDHKEFVSDENIPIGKYQGKNYQINDFCVNIEKLRITSVLSNELLETFTNTPIKNKRSPTQKEVLPKDISIHENDYDKTVNSESVEAIEPSIQEANLENGFLNKFTDFIKNINNDRNIEEDSLISENYDTTFNESKRQTESKENPGKIMKKRKSLEMLKASADIILDNKRTRAEKKLIENNDETHENDDKFEDNGFDDSVSNDNGGNLDQSEGNEFLFMLKTVILSPMRQPNL